MFQDEFSATTTVRDPTVPYSSLLTKPINLPLNVREELDTPSSDEFERSEEMSVKVSYLKQGQKKNQ